MADPAHSPKALVVWECDVRFLEGTHQPVRTPQPYPAASGCVSPTPQSRMPDQLHAHHHQRLRHRHGQGDDQKTASDDVLDASFPMQSDAEFSSDSQELGRRRRHFKRQRATSCRGDHNHGKLSSLRPERTTRVFADDSEEQRAKKERRKEQCRVNQAKYRERKRAQEVLLEGEINVLEAEIEKLERWRDTAVNHNQERGSSKHVDDQELVVLDQLSPIEQIGAFFIDFERADVHVMPDFHYDVVTRVLTPQDVSLSCLFDLQHQTFKSMCELELQWRWYRQQFQSFRLEMRSTSQSAVESHSIFVVQSQLHVMLPPEVLVDKTRDLVVPSQEATSGWHLICPVRHQFDIHEHDGVISRITNEIDWLEGLTCLLQCRPDEGLVVLRRLAVVISTTGQVCEV